MTPIDFIIICAATGCGALWLTEKYLDRRQERLRRRIEGSPAWWELAYAAEDYLKDNSAHARHRLERALEALD